MSKRGVIFCVTIGAMLLCMRQLELAGASRAQAEEITQYVERVLTDEAEFALKSPANKNLKGVKKGKYRCMEGHWRMVDNGPVFICD